MATSDRQSLKEDDPRFEALTDYLEKVLREVGNKWQIRRRDALDKARKNPVMRVVTLGADQKKYAKSLFGKIGNIALKEADRLEDCTSMGCLPSNGSGYADCLEVDKPRADKPHSLTSGQSLRRMSMTSKPRCNQIAKGRISIIGSFVKPSTMMPRRGHQQHLFDHLWLLDTSWRRRQRTRE